MRKNNKDKPILESPFYPGGPKAIRDFLLNNMQYPEEAKKNKIEGIVSLKIDINHLGQVIKAKTINNIGHGCDNEALRLVRLLKYTCPKARGVKVIFHKKINIHFQLPKEETVNPPSYSYTYVEKSKKASYQYTIDKNLD